MAWAFDPSHTSAKFQARHLMISNVNGQFDVVTGTIDFNEAAPEKTVVDVKIAADSVNTKDEKRDGHLKSPDFFDAANYPTIEYKSTRVERTGESTAKMHGDLTIKGISKPVVLDVEFLGKAKAPWGSWSAGFEAKGKINREDWGLTWNVPLEQGGWLVGKDIKIDIAAELIQQPKEQPVAAAEKAAA